jgi:N-acetylmuramoyl-L-alanine amidase
MRKRGYIMKVFVCVGHANYGSGVISSADGTKNGGVNEYNYNKALAPYVVKWLQAAGHEAVLCIAPEGQLHSLNDEITYFIGEEKKANYDLSIQLHLNAFDGTAHGAEAYAYNDAGLKVAEAICSKLATVWTNRKAKINTSLYWTRKTKAKAVLIESFFCDSASDYEKAKKLGYDAHGKLIAEGIIGKDISGTTNSTQTASTKVESDSVKYYVQCGAYNKKENAQSYVDKLKKSGFDAIIKTAVSGTAKYYVQAGAYKNKDKAQELVDKLKKAGFSAIIKNA